VTGVTPVIGAGLRSILRLDISNLASSSALQSLFAPPAASAGSAAPAASSAVAASSTSGSSASAQSPAVQAESLIASSESALFSSITDGSASVLPDLSGLTATAQAYSLYTNPALLQQLAAGSSSGASASGSSTGSTGAAFAPPAYSFNPFDEASWWTDPSALGSTVDATA
jgi:hypothetical protein